MKETLRKFLMASLGLVVGIVTMVMVMIKGWGIQPKSWWWIIGVYLIGSIVSAGLCELSKAKK